MIRRRLIFWSAATFALGLAFACGSSDDSAAPVGDAGNATDTGTLDQFAGDSGGGTDSGVGGYHDIGDKSLWSTFDLATFDADLAHGTGFFGGAFDGRYVYLIPYQRGVAGDASASVLSGLIVRYDTQMTFNSAGAWSSFDVTNVFANALAFFSSAFDGRYLYLLPGPASSFVARYDTQAAFDAVASWTTYQLTTSSFAGAALDGHYLYTAAAEGTPVVERYDTTSSFDAGGAWTSFDPTPLTPSVKGLVSAVYDGRYVYFGAGTPGPANGVAARYDTQMAFGTASSWTSFDITTAYPKANAFAGGVFDGRYVYFAPYYASGVPSGEVARYDTQASFNSAGAWMAFDTTPVTTTAMACWGAVFDGRYVYMVPWLGSQIQRYDTTLPFGQQTSWSAFDSTTLDPNAQRFHGGVFDGRYVYFVPSELSVVVRFDAKNPPAIPASYHGTFF